MISKNSHIGPINWMNSNQNYKTTSSMIVDSHKKLINHNLQQAIIKHNWDSHKKPHTIHRHYSEDDFKKHSINQQMYIAEPPSKAEDEYFPDTGSPIGKNSKHVYSREKSGKHRQKPIHPQKSTLQKLGSRSNGLKETSSTQSAENLGMRPAPSFVKSIFYNNFKNSGPTLNKRSSSNKHIIKRENFKIISKLGQGKFGKVFMVKQIQTGFILAMKIIQKKRIIRQKLLDQFIRELKIQSFLDHPNIIGLYGFFCDETHFYTLMELGCDGQLYSLLTLNKAMSEQTTSFIVKNLLEAILYIHTNKVLHRDVKPQNIVLIMGNVKICDFGWAASKMHPGDMRNTFCGTPLYLSPEIIQGNKYDEKVDLWAIGILAFQLYLGCTPFSINDQADLFKITTQSIRFPSDKQISQQFKQFILAMLTKNPNERLTSKSLLQMDFITKYKDFETCEQLCK